MIKIKDNKWTRGALPALLIHVCIGSVYCWSLLKNEIAQEMGVQTSSIEFAFSLAIFFLGMSAAFCGRFIEKKVNISSLISGICFSSGLILSIISIKSGSVTGLLLSYGALMGIGLGIGYLSPVKTLMMWFSDHKGLATGIAISGFGLSKALLSPFIVWCNKMFSVCTTLGCISILGLVCILLAAWLIKKPKPEEGAALNLRESLKIISNPSYIKIWLIFYLNITCGLALISFEKSISLSASIVAVGLISSLTAIFNTLGRFGYSSISDLCAKKENIYLVIFGSSILACFASGIFPGSMISIVIMLCVINAGYGGGFSTLPILLQSKFGMKNISTIHGFALSAWAWAGLSGNQLTSLIVERLNLGWPVLYMILVILYVISFSIAWSIKKEG